ncbi:MAG: MFS transporter [Oscillospiraceae bacterium]|jgi:Na+/melibiose symporter-like transporter|nr:MFS transporter [Oscillospiraceae bacterium]
MRNQEKRKPYDGILPQDERRSYYLGAFGQGMLYAIMSSYISDFYLNVMGLGEIFVFFLMLLARVWDAVNDPLMGVLMDRAQPKRGKMRSYLFIVPLPVALLTVLLFWAPPLPGGAKLVYAAATYVLWGMLYTVGDIPFWSLPNAMTPNPQERGRVISLSRTFNGVGSALPMALVMGLGPLLSGLGYRGNALEQRKYLFAAIAAAGAGGLLYYYSAFRVRERVPLPRASKAEGRPTALSVVFRCKPLMLVILTGILSCGRYMFQAGAIHVARYSFYLGPALAGLSPQAREDALQSSISQVQLIFQIAIALGMFGSMLLIPKLIRRFSYKSLIISSSLLGGFAALAMYSVGYESLWLCVPFLVLCSIPLGVINVVCYAMVGDALDYMEYKTGFRQNGLGQACQSFVLKLGNALATSAIVLTYRIVSLDLSAVTGAGMTIDPSALQNAAAVRGGMFSLISLVPAVSLFLCVIPLFFYDLTGKKKARVTEELARRRRENSAESC